MGEFNSKDHSLYLLLWERMPYKMWSSSPSQCAVQNAVLACNYENARMTSVFSQSKPFIITVIQTYAPTTNAKEPEVEWFYEYVHDFSEPRPKKKKDAHCIIGDWNGKVGTQKIPRATGKLGLGYKAKQGKH